MTPEESLKKLTNYAKQIALAKTQYVAVGLPVESIGNKAYKNGAQLMQVGASHEYGVGDMRRSFLREPFSLKVNDITDRIDSEFKAIFEGSRNTDAAMGRIGVTAVNISKGAFTTGGYGMWTDITQETKDKKGSSQILIDSGLLRTSITYVVRG